MTAVHPERTPGAGTKRQISFTSIRLLARRTRGWLNGPPDAGPAVRSSGKTQMNAAPREGKLSITLPRFRRLTFHLRLEPRAMLTIGIALAGVIFILRNTDPSEQAFLE